MINILRDSIWQFVGVVVSIIALAVSVYVIFSQSKKKSLAYQISAETNLLQVGEEIKDKVKITYENIPLENIYFMSIIVINNGSLEIKPSDFERELSFEVEGSSRIISAEIMQTEPDELRPNISISPKKVFLKPLLLNSRDFILIKLLIAEYSGEVQADVRVVGVKRLIRLRTTPSFQPRIIVAINWLLIVVCAASFLLIFAYSLLFPDREIPQLVLNAFYSTLGWFGGVMAYYFSIDSTKSSKL